MISNQKFIEIGPGFTDVYELFEIMKTNASRLDRTFIFRFEKEESVVYSIAASFRPVGKSKFLPIYICREGIVEAIDQEQPSKRRAQFIQLCDDLQHPSTTLQVKHSSDFADTDLFYQYITGILRLNRLLPPLY